MCPFLLQCLNMYLQYVDDDENSSELLQMLENLKEQRLREQAMPYESQLTALNASQQDFLVSLARDTVPQFPINAHPVREGPTGVNIYQPKPVKEAIPPPLAVAGEDVTLQQAAASLPGKLQYDIIVCRFLKIIDRRVALIRITFFLFPPRNCQTVSPRFLLDL